MAYVAHNRLTILGDFRDATDTIEWWACTVNFGGDLAVGTAAAPTHNSAISEALEDWWTDETNGYMYSLSVRCRLTGFKWNHIGTDGKYTDPSHPNTYAYTTPLTGNTGTTTPYCPPQIACVVSLRTGMAGKTRNGRVYLPMDGVQPTSSYTIGTTTIDHVTAGFAQLLTDLSDLTGTLTTGTPIVASSKGYNSEVTDVRVGNRFDTQRRRRRSLIETYSTAASVPVA